MQAMIVSLEATWKEKKAAWKEKNNIKLFTDYIYRILLI